MAIRKVSQASTRSNEKAEIQHNDDGTSRIVSNKKKETAMLASPLVIGTPTRQSPIGRLLLSIGSTPQKRKPSYTTKRMDMPDTQERRTSVQSSLEHALAPTKALTPRRSMFRRSASERKSNRNPAAGKMKNFSSLDDDDDSYNSDNDENGTPSVPAKSTRKRVPNQKIRKDMKKSELDSAATVGGPGKKKIKNKKSTKKSSCNLFAAEGPQFDLALEASKEPSGFESGFLPMLQRSQSTRYSGTSSNSLPPGLYRASSTTRLVSNGLEDADIRTVASTRRKRIRPVVTVRPKKSQSLPLEALPCSGGGSCTRNVSVRSNSISPTGAPIDEASANVESPARKASALPLLVRMPKHPATPRRSALVRSSSLRSQRSVGSINMVVSNRTLPPGTPPKSKTRRRNKLLSSSTSVCEGPVRRETNSPTKAATRKPRKSSSVSESLSSTRSVQTATTVANTTIDGTINTPNEDIRSNVHNAISEIDLLISCYSPIVTPKQSRKTCLTKSPPPSTTVRSYRRRRGGNDQDISLITSKKDGRYLFTETEPKYLYSLVGQALQLQIQQGETSSGRKIDGPLPSAPPCSPLSPDTDEHPLRDEAELSTNFEDSLNASMLLPLRLPLSSLTMSTSTVGISHDSYSMGNSLVDI